MVDAVSFESGVFQSGVFGGAMLGQAALIDILTDLGLTDSLELCLDAGDSDSYSSGQSWLDTSGNGYDFFRGADGSAGADDPTFNGSAGGLSSAEYWGFDGGDFFTLDQSNPTWVNNLHKDGATCTFLAWIYLVSADDGDSEDVVFTWGASPFTGFNVSIDPTDATYPFIPYVRVRNAGTQVYITSPAPLVANPDAWNFIAISVNEVANAALWQVNGDVNSDTATYSSPAAGDASDTMRLGTYQAGSDFFSNGVRLGALGGFSAALSAAQMNAVFQATRGRFGV